MKKKSLIIAFLFIFITVLSGCGKQNEEQGNEMDYMPRDTVQSVSMADSLDPGSVGEITKKENEEDLIKVYDIFAQSEYIPYDEYDNEVTLDGNSVKSVDMTFAVKNNDSQRADTVYANWNIESGRLKIWEESDYTYASDRFQSLMGESEYYYINGEYTFYVEKYIDEEASEELEELFYKFLE